MAIEKVVIETIVCDKDGKKGKKEDGWKVNVTLQFGDVKWKGDLCPQCHSTGMGFIDGFLDGLVNAAPEADEYDPTTDRAFSKYTPEQARHHRAAKLWAVSDESTMKGNERPKGLKGPAGDKVIDAYQAYLKELEARKADAGKQPAPA